MYSSPVFTIVSIVTFLALVAVLVLQALEMKCYGMF